MTHTIALAVKDWIETTYPNIADPSITEIKAQLVDETHYTIDTPDRVINIYFKLNALTTKTDDPQPDLRIPYSDPNLLGKLKTFLDQKLPK